MLSIQGLFIDTGHTAEKHRVVYVSKHVREKKNSLQVKFRLKPPKRLGLCVLKEVDELLHDVLRAPQEMLSKWIQARLSF